MGNLVLGLCCQVGKGQGARREEEEVLLIMILVLLLNTVVMMLMKFIMIIRRVGCPQQWIALE